jgi:hypothetical protein
VGGYTYHDSRLPTLQGVVGRGFYEICEKIMPILLNIERSIESTNISRPSRGGFFYF